MPRQIGWSQESNLLYNISMQLDRLAAVTAASGGGGGGTITGGGAAGQVTFWNGATNITGSNNLFWNNATTRLGIGTPTPISILDISSNGGRLSLTQNAAGSIFNGIDFVSSIGGAYASIIGNQNTGEIRLSAVATYFYTIYGGGSERMRITSTGNVGIGNINPTYTLDVNGTGRYQDNLLVQKSQNGTTSVSIQNFTAGTASVVEFKAQTDGSRILTFGKYSTSTTSFKTINGGDGYIYNSSQGGDISILNDTTVGTIKFAAGGVSTAQMTLFSTGNLVIGNTSDATYKLDVNGTSIFRNQLRVEGTGAGTVVNLLYQSGGSTAFSVNNTGDGVLRNSLTTPTVNTNAVTAQVNQNLTLSAPWANNNVVNIQTWNGSPIGTRINLTANNVRTAGSHILLQLDENFVPPSGNATFTTAFITPTINQQGGANGITRGILVSPTLTVGAVADWRSIETSNNTGWAFYAGGTAPSLFNGDVSISGKLALTVVANRQTVNYSLVLADNGKLVEMNVGAANTLTVPPNSSITFPIGTKIDIAQYGAGQTTIVPGAGVTVRSALGALKLAAQYSGASLVKIGTDEWYLFGDITV